MASVHSRPAMKKVSRVAIRRFSNVSNMPKDFPTYDPTNTASVFEKTSTIDLVNNAVLFHVLANEKWVDYGTKSAVAILFKEFPQSRLFKQYPTPVRFCTKHFLMWTVLQTFYSGDYFEDCIDLAEVWYQREGITGIADYSCSEDNDDPKRFEDHMNATIDDYGNLQKEVDNGGIRFGAVKPTSLLDPGMLERLTLVLQSQHAEQGSDDEFELIDPSEFLDAKDSTMYRHGSARLEKLIRYASQAKVALLLDAEKSHLQPAVELIAQIMAEKYNRIGRPAAIYNTYQMYLRRSPAALERDMKRAEKKGYRFAAKVVRGAYMLSERETAAEDPEGDDPVLVTREETDDAFNQAVCDVLQAISAASAPSSVPVAVPSIMIATHNRQSLQLAVDNMQRLDIRNDSPNVNFAQILGMCDNLTVSLARSGYNANKLFLYGPFTHVFPWLLRRMDENKDTLGAMQLEKKSYWAELRRRVGMA